jgi:hypothetical protein
MMTGIKGTDEQVPVRGDYSAPVILNPVFSDPRCGTRRGGQ